MLQDYIIRKVGNHSFGSMHSKESRKHTNERAGNNFDENAHFEKVENQHFSLSLVYWHEY